MIELIIENDWLESQEYHSFVLQNSDNGTIFHLYEFNKYHSNDFYNCKEKIHFKFYKKNKIIASIFGVIDKNQEDVFFKSPYGASYGGFIVHKDISFDESEQIFKIFQDKIIELKIYKLQIVNTSSIHSLNNKIEYFDFIFSANEFFLQKLDILLVYDCKNNEDVFLSFERKTKTELRQAIDNSNLNVKIISGIDENSYSILLNSQKRLNSVPTHTFEDLLEINKLLPDSIITCKILNGECQVAGITMMRVNEKVLNTFYIYDVFESRDLKANHLAYYKVIEYAKNNSYSYLDFGPSSFGFIPNYPLIKFKEKFGTFPVNRRTFYKSVNSL
jgi:lipid II:glycine glycyltransferase (peptidoglycan interpeptide bridge formation enzyme)